MMNSVPDLAAVPRVLRILLAEDDDDTRSLLARVLVRAGHQVVEMEDGFELSDYLELLARGKVPQPPDLILTDVRMPGRTGLELLAQVQAARIGCPVVLLSAFMDDRTRQEARRLGASAVLVKPVDFDTLEATLQECARH